MNPPCTDCGKPVDDDMEFRCLACKRARRIKYGLRGGVK